MKTSQRVPTKLSLEFYLGELSEQHFHNASDTSCIRPASWLLARCPLARCRYKIMQWVRKCLTYANGATASIHPHFRAVQTHQHGTRHNHRALCLVSYLSNMQLTQSATDHSPPGCRITLPNDWQGKEMRHLPAGHSK